MFIEFSDKISIYIISIDDDLFIQAILKTNFFSVLSIIINLIFERLLSNKIESIVFNKKFIKEIKLNEHEYLKILDQNSSQDFSGVFQCNEGKNRFIIKIENCINIINSYALNNRV